MIILVAAGLIALVNSLPFVENEHFESLPIEDLTKVGDDETSIRSKRTIGILRQLFPEITQIIEKKVNMIVAEVIRVLGPTVLQGFLGGGRGKSKSNGDNSNDDVDDGSTVTVAVPVDDDDDDEDEVKNVVSNNNNGNNLKDMSEKISLPLPTASSDTENEDNSTTSTTMSIELSTSDGSLSEGRMFGYFASSYHESQKKKTSNKLACGMLAYYYTVNVNRARYQQQEDIDAEASENNEVRVSFEDIQPAANEAVESELTPLDDIEVSDDESRNKRLVNLDGNSGSGSGGGSGNFLFDIIRQLVAGSGSQLSSDGQSSGKSVEADEAVPGPATRFLVIANRGISNLIQDLILRIAATSERFVNFKARLITSII
ncbi:hypothetical protein PV327_005394 [Microctonus hyperodae]|uniref:Uncharacterized protein n=1 Tax=Microctonus hyperodae TaxID=165561 RepID=A0AA39G194_MICHY|nr:hypothetical protein PV327_005394 [Microctonus hyperodae]